MPKSPAKLACLFLLLCIGCQQPGSDDQPPESRFRKRILCENQQELRGTIAFDFAPNGNVYMIDLSGRVKTFNPANGQFTIIGKFDGGEYGLIGMKLDPVFDSNHFIYLQYFVADTMKFSDGHSRRIMHISRFTVDNDTILPASEKNYLKIPYEHECCHTGGGMDFDNDKNLYVSTGDNTGAFFTQYSPSVNLPGHLIDDALRSAGNTNDDRGKILRIHPEPDGSFTIPRGNLFSKEEKGTKPEIYVMGVRNPYRLTIDRKTNSLYWGEVGPDAAKDSTAGPRGYDEFNHAKRAGNFGWPLVIANNQPYAKVNYENIEKSFYTNNPDSPVNFSINNSGLKALPAAQPAIIWYPYDSSRIFSSFGSGGRTAIGGPVYQFDPHLESGIKFPKYFDHAWFIADWMRNWVKAVKLNDDGDMQSVVNFLPNEHFIKPMFMKFGADGALYLLEYGSSWAENNPDVRFSRIEYIAGNREPVAEIKADTIAGSQGLGFALSGAGSFDYDQDDLHFAWKDNTGKMLGSQKTIRTTFAKPGTYSVSLEVSDDKGGKTVKDTVLIAGIPPVVKLQVTNRSFYWDTIHYSFLVTDPVLVDLTHGSSGQFRSSIQVFDNDAIGLAIKPGQVNAGERMMHESDCQACHQMDAKSAGPSLRAISEKYRTDASAIDRLARKILTGGSGVWGAINMSAHPQLSMSQAQEIVRYIYSLTALDLPSSTIPPVGLIKTAAGGRKSRESDRLFKISGAYLSDRKEFKAFAYRDSVLLRNAVVQAGDFDQYSDAYASKGLVKGHSFSYVTLSKVDLSGIKTLKITASGPIELRADSHNGKLLGRSSVIEQRDLLQTTVQLTPVAGMHDIFIVFSVGKNGFILNEELKSVEFVK